MPRVKWTGARTVSRVRRLAMAIAVALLGVHVSAAGAAKTVPAPFVGVVADGPLLDDPSVNYAKQLDLMVASGVQTMRASFNWTGIQRYKSFADVPPDHARSLQGRERRADRLHGHRPARGERRGTAHRRPARADHRPRLGGALPRPHVVAAERLRRLRPLRRRPGSPLRPHGLVLEREPGRAEGADPLLADLERALVPPVLGGPALGGRLREDAEARVQRDPPGRPPREGRARGPAERRAGIPST